MKEILPLLRILQIKYEKEEYFPHFQAQTTGLLAISVGVRSWIVREPSIWVRDLICNYNRGEVRNLFCLTDASKII